MLIIRHLSLVPPNTVNEEQKLKDPLWHSWQLMDEFERNCVAVAVPEGTVAFDEASLGTKARTLANLEFFIFVRFVAPGYQM